MKINEKILQLVKSGLKATMLTTLSESQINTLHKRLVESKKVTTEQNTPPKVMTKQVKQYELQPNSQTNINGLEVSNKGGKTVVTQTNESDSIDSEIDEKFESKKQQKYFFAKCGDGKTKEQKKWCKMADEFAKKTNFDKLPEKKTETNEKLEGYPKLMANTMANKLEKDILNTFTNESDLEKQITRLVEKHITPKMTKQDFITTIKSVMVESPKFKKPKIKKMLPIVSLEENELPDWLTSKSIGLK